MEHLPHLITDLGLILAAAAVITLLFKRLKQPIVLGYIIAGLVVGPHFSVLPTIADSATVEVWAQIGVIFLLFSLGLEFSFKKLMKVGGPAAITAITEVTMMIAIGYGIGRAMGWTAVNSLFLGGMLSISSTTIIIRTFDELGLKGKKFTNLVFGILVIQDLVAIVLLVLLPASATKDELTGLSLLLPVAKLVFFLVLWFVTGIFFLPTILRRAGRIMNDEMMLISSIALCFAMVILATSAGFSPALGAFVMGSILADTMVGGKIEHLTKSIKELFGAVFFISVGMMIDPRILPAYWVQILFITLTVMIAQPLFSIAGALISGQSLKVSVQAGMSLSQIGEFSFIIATLGTGLHVTAPFLYPVIVAVSAITTFTTPYMIRLSSPVYKLLERLLPEKLKETLTIYSAETQSVKATSEWKLFLRSWMLQTAIFTTVIFALLLVLHRYVAPLWRNSNNHIVNITATALALLAVSPFIWALTVRYMLAGNTLRIWRLKTYTSQLIMLHGLRILIALVMVAFVIRSLLPYYMALATIAVVIVLIVINYRRLSGVYDRIENRFLVNFHEKERSELRERGVHLVPWDAHITNFVLTPDFTGIGQTLAELQLRERFGINIAKIKRGSYVINVPDRKERLYPGDNLFVIGSDEQIEFFKIFLDASSKATINYKSPEQEVTLMQLEIIPGSQLIGKTIKDSAFREHTKALIVGIERGRQRTLNPDSSFTIEQDDILWVVGNRKRIRLLIRKGFIAS